MMPLHRETDLPDAPPQSLAEALHVRDADGRWSVGGRAAIRISQEIPLLRPIGALGRFPPVRALIDRGCAVVARNRHRISRLLGAQVCAVDPERRSASPR